MYLGMETAVLPPEGVKNSGHSDEINKSHGAEDDRILLFFNIYLNCFVSAHCKFTIHSMYYYVELIYYMVEMFKILKRKGKKMKPQVIIKASSMYTCIYTDAHTYTYK